ncbi:DUF523 domain-containing protein [Catenovulum sp. SM1970]|uniref:DUF523 domain-containing protein n=1 Tax=Marinifaba aquimaris TaxID=2741323 RepID=UPI0015731C54|nr:DUF523 domain-containing protein [Marinifaba aquimaris]NTS76824.1 DUF523 domain-containing protein [Marinifaba aquimaris]
MKIAKEPVLVSACLLGQPVRYDGQAKSYPHPLFTALSALNLLHSFCPECAGGLPTPRPPAEQQSDGRVITHRGIDVTEQFATGAKKALALCQAEHIKYAVLKANSPSCGNEQIYDGQFEGRLIAGQGVTAKLLTAHQIQVFNEHQLDELTKLLERQA